MEAQLIRVVVLSNDTVKPSCPTPAERKTITLSFLDESFPTFHIPWIQTFTSNDEPIEPIKLINSLKTSLSETLTHFYPLAGRFENEYTVSCNDQGIPLIFTRVECQLKDYLNSPKKLEMVSKFLPPPDIRSLGHLPITTVVPLAFQVNIFMCGAVAIGSYFIHKLIDANSMSIFLNYWSAKASGRYKDLIEPDFDTIVRLFPLLPKEKRVKTMSDATGPAPAPSGLSRQLNLPIKVVVKSFKFSNEAISKLKARAIALRLWPGSSGCTPWMLFYNTIMTILPLRSLSLPCFSAAQI